MGNICVVRGAVQAMKQRYEQVFGSDLSDAKELIRIGIRNRDREVGAVGYERLEKLMGKLYALRVLLVEQILWEREQGI